MQNSANRLSNHITSVPNSVHSPTINQPKPRHCIMTNSTQPTQVCPWTLDKNQPSTQPRTIKPSKVHDRSQKLIDSSKWCISQFTKMKCFLIGNIDHLASTMDRSWHCTQTPAQCLLQMNWRLWLASSPLFSWTVLPPSASNHNVLLQANQRVLWQPWVDSISH